MKMTVANNNITRKQTPSVQSEVVSKTCGKSQTLTLEKTISSKSLLSSIILIENGILFSIYIFDLLVDCNGSALPT